MVFVANLIIADDVEALHNSLTQTARDSLRESVKELESILSSGGRIVFLGTPQYHDSLYHEMRNRGYLCRVWPARYPTGKQ
ncbi:MAG: DNA maturase B, partial [Planctomycetota bacterium]|nr:DNA maturase B [Planctomycetota bacterium]